MHYMDWYSDLMWFAQTCDDPELYSRVMDCIMREWWKS